MIQLSNYEYPLAWRIFITIAGTMFNMILINPIFYFSIIYGELCIVLVSWGKSIEELVSIEDTIGASKNFVKLLGKVSTTISSALFWQIANLQVGLILWVFVSLIFIIFHNPGKIISFHLYNSINSYGEILGTNQITTNEIILCCGNLIGCFTIALQLLYLCTFGEQVARIVQDINTKILESQTSNEIGLGVSVQLQNFHGFSANGFFTVNHSLLTGMTANFLTYMVILIQFQQSSSSTPG